MHQLIEKKNDLFPMPVLLISTYNVDGTVDTMNAAWGTMEDFDVLLLELSKNHMTCKNIEREKVFTVAFATAKHVKEADYFGVVSANDVKDKFEKSGLHYHDAGVIHAPIIDEYPVSLLCKLERIDETNGDYVVYGKILSTSINDEYLDDKGNLDFEKCEFITYCSNDQSYRLVSKSVAKAFKVGFEIK